MKTLLTTTIAIILVSTATATAATLITGTQIKNGTITAIDLKRNTIPLNRIEYRTAVWLTDTSQRTQNGTIPARGTIRLTARCTPLGYATGGGMKTTLPTDGASITITETYPEPGNRAWTTTAYNPTDRPIMVDAKATCSTPVIG